MSLHSPYLFFIARVKDLLSITHLLLLALAMVMTLSSCRGEEEVPIVDEQLHPIAFTSVTEELEQQTRATSPLARDFVAYAYKKTGETTEEEVIDGYTIKYNEGSANTSEDNTHGYSYVGGNQTLKYWDFGAGEYHFWAASVKSPGSASFSGDKHNILTIPIKLSKGEYSSLDDVLYSSLLVRHPVSADVVRLSFKRPYAKLCVQFYTTEALAAGDEITVSDITFSPDPSAASPKINKIYTQGDVVVNYPPSTDACEGKAQETINVVNLSFPQIHFQFTDVTLTPTKGTTSNTAVTATIDGTNPYYCLLPMGELNPAFTMKVSIDGEEKTATVPAAYMLWKPNFFYTYIFKITEAGKRIEFFDVKIDPWHYGGSQDKEWRNW